MENIYKILTMNFFKIHKPLKYRYRPIYYDPKKEAQKEREKKANQEAEGSEEETYQPKILRRGTFREMHDKNTQARRQQNRQSNIRLIIIILFLFLIAYFLMR